MGSSIGSASHCLANYSISQIFEGLLSFEEQINHVVWTVAGVGEFFVQGLGMVWKGSSCDLLPVV